MPAEPHKASQFGRSTASKDTRLAQLRARLAAATPATAKPITRYTVDWRRSGMAIALILIFVLALLFS